MASSEQMRLQYQEKAVNAARPEELTLMLYNGLIKFIGRAKEEIERKDYEAAHNTLVRCQDIVFEFQFTLNMEYEVSDNLMKLYDYMYNRLIEANAKKDTSILDEVMGFAVDLRDTWAEAVRNLSSAAAQAAAAAAQPPAEEAAAAAPGEEPEGAAAAPAPAPKLSSPKAIYSRNAMPVGFAGSRPAKAPAAAKAQPAPAAQPAAKAQPAKPAAQEAKPEAAPAAVVVAPGGSVASRVFGNPMNRINPAAAAQYAKVAKSKAPAEEAISIASR